MEAACKVDDYYAARPCARRAEPLHPTTAPPRRLSLSVDEGERHARIGCT